MQFSVCGHPVEKTLRLMAILEGDSLPKPIRIATVEILRHDMRKVQIMKTETGYELAIIYSYITVHGVDNMLPPGLLLTSLPRQPQSGIGGLWPLLAPIPIAITWNWGSPAAARVTTPVAIVWNRGISCY